MSDLSGKYKVYLGNRDRGLRYTVADRERLEGMFPRPDGTPNALIDLIQNHIVANGSFAVQAAVVWAGLNRVDSKITLSKVKDWLEKETQTKGEATVGLILRTTLNAVFASGVLGKVIEDAFSEGSEEEAEVPKEPES
jgi:hypothetical protein